MATPSIDYSSRDFASIREDLINRAAVTLPEWRTQDASDFTTLLVELWAHAADVLHFYVDRAANEAFTQTAVLRSSMLNLAGMLDYVPVGQQAATATVTFSRSTGFVGSIVIPKGTKVMTVPVGTDAPVYFETTAEVTMSGATIDATVVEGTTVTLEATGTSNGQPFQEMTLYYQNVITDSWEVYVYEGSGGAAVQWQPVERLIDSGPLDSAFTTFVDEYDTTYILFGDGVNGRIPPVNTVVKVTYRYGQGTKGNVGAGGISALSNGIGGVGGVSNAAPATGGVDRESIESLRSSIPLSLRAQDRAVTTADYAALALKVAGVTKSNAYWTVGTPNQVNVYIAPSTATAAPAPLITDVGSYITARAVVGKTVVVASATYVPINITVSIVVLSNKVQQWVKNDVSDALQALLAFDSVGFAERITLGEVFRATDVDGVDYYTVDVVSTSGSGVTDVLLAYNQIPTVGTITVNATGGIVGP